MVQNIWSGPDPESTEPGNFYGLACSLHPEKCYISSCRLFDEISEGVRQDGYVASQQHRTHRRDIKG